MKWVIYELKQWRRVGIYTNRIAAINMVHALHRDIPEHRYTVTKEVI